MLRRALLAAAALSYLICVLVLSGMQKEDLDVSMLRKLQRYNVNIGDMNNERLRQECTVKNKNFADLKADKIDEDFISKTEITTEMTTVTTEQQSKTLSIEAVVYYLKTQKDSFFNFNESTTTTTEKGLNINEETNKSDNNNSLNLDMNLLQRFIKKETSKRYVEKRTSPVYNMNQSNNVNIKEIPITLKDVEFIDKIFEGYLVHKQSTSTTTEYPTPKHSINIGNFYKEIDKLIKNASIEVNREKKKNFEDKAAANIFKNYISDPVHAILQDQNRSEEGNKGLSSIYEFLNMINRFKTYSSLTLFQDNNTANNYNKQLTGNDYKQEEKILDTVTQNNQIKYKVNKTSNTEQNRDVKEKVVSPNLVKEIAETVKNVIIKDLRKELTKIYLKPIQNTVVTESITTTTTETPATSPMTSTINIQEKEIVIMDTFMELYEQIKALKQTAYVLEAHNKTKTRVSKDFRQEIKSFPMGRTFSPLVDRIRYPVGGNLPVSTVDNYNTKQFVNLDPYIPKQIKNHRSPITIQTNSVEIRPLVVPLTKPESIIRQNIVVHPRESIQNNRPSQIFPKQYNYPEVINTHRNKTHYYSSIERYDKYNAEHYSLPYVYRKPMYIGEDVRLRMTKEGNSQFDTDYYEKINLDNHDNRVNHKNRIFRNLHVPKFHERLERMDDRYPMVTNRGIIHKKVSNNNVPSRQQLSLVDMKKGTSYDDTHFKNFLKSQQKVTDILERILANRPNASRPWSEEAKFIK